MDTNILTIYCISFLDSLCFGLIMPVLAPQILSVGGSHIILGILASLQIILQSLSGPVTRTLVDKLGKKTTLILEQCIALITNILLGYTSVYWQIFIIRCIFYLTNQTQTLCKSIAAENTPYRSKSSPVFGTMGALGSLGFVIGPIIGGHLYESETGFLYISLLCALSTIISIVLTTLLPASSKVKEETTFLQKVQEDFVAFRNKFNDIHFYDELDILLPPILITASLTSFFSKFSVLLRVHYQGTASLIGYTVAYHSTILFLASFIGPYIQQQLQAKSKYLLQYYVKTLLTLLITIFGTCFSSTYMFYLVSFFALSIVHNLMNAFHKDICLSRVDGKNEKLVKASDGLNSLSSIMTPILLGINVDIFGHYAIKAFCLIPIVITLYFLHFSRNILVAQKDEEAKKTKKVK